MATGVLSLSRSDEIISNLVQKGFGHVPEPGALEVTVDTDIGREAYISMFGPTTGDRVRLGDTALWIEVEHDEVRLLCQVPESLLMAAQTVYGDEVKFGGGKPVSLRHFRLLRVSA